MKNAALVAAMAHPTLSKIATCQAEIHDEIQWRCLPEYTEEVVALSKQIMENSYVIPCKTSHGVGKNWYDAK